MSLIYVPGKARPPTFYEPRMVRAPEVLVPRMFLDRPLVPDRNHPVGRNIVAYILPGSGHAASGVTRVSTPNGRSFSVSPSQYLETRRSVMLASGFSIVFWVYSPTGPGGGEFTYCKAQQDGTGDYLRLFNRWNNQNILFLDSSAQGWLTNCGYDSASNWGGGFRTYAGRYINHTSGQLFIDGRKVSQWTSGYYTFNWSYPFKLIVEAVGNKVFGAILVRGPVTDNDMDWLHKDPLQAFAAA